MGMAFSSISTLGVTTPFETLTKQAKLASNTFSFYLASAGSQLYLGGLDSSKFKAGSTKTYPVTNAGYWLLDAKVNVAGTPVAAVGKFSAIIDTGTSVIVVSPFALNSTVVANSS
jgi:cathepsin D